MGKLFVWECNENIVETSWESYTVRSLTCLRSGRPSKSVPVVSPVQGLLVCLQVVTNIVYPSYIHGISNIINIARVVNCVFSMK
jgi:hypothetical protein